jgi:hypothetical protein
MTPSVEGSGVRHALYLTTLGLIYAWTGYCVLDFIYVALNYWSAVPWLGLIPIFTEPRVEPGFWGGYLKQLATAWGSIVTGLGVVALLLRPTVEVVEGESVAPALSYPVVPESERTEPRLLYIEEQQPPPFDRHAQEARRDIERRVSRSAERLPEERPEPRWESERGPLPSKEARREPEPLREGNESGIARPHPLRSSPILRALRGRSGAAMQPRASEPMRSSEPEPPDFADEEYATFEVYYDDGTTTIERLHRAEFADDEARAIGVLRRRLAEEVAAGGRPPKAIRAISQIG